MRTQSKPVETVTERQRNLIEDLNLIENPQERLSVLVDRARHLSPLPAEARTESNLVPGCISQVWLLCTRDTAGHCHFRCDADSPLVKALVAFLCDYYSNCTPEEILADSINSDEAKPLAALGLLQTLSPTRRNGLAQVRARIHSFAQKHVNA